MHESTSQQLQALLRHRQQQTDQQAAQQKSMTSVPPLPADYLDAINVVHQMLTDNAPTSAQSPMLTAQAFDALTARNHELTTQPEAISAALASQTQLLERLFLRYIQRAETSTKPEHRHLAMRTALACQRQLVSTLSAIYQVHRDQTQT